MTDAPATPPAHGPARALKWIFLGQIAFAAVLLGSDMMGALPSLLSPSRAPGIDAPVAPGDQTRRYAPGDLPAREARPGSVPLPSSTDMPSRLAFETREVEGERALLLVGEIAPGDSARLRDHLAGAGSTLPQTVLLDSPGGSVRDAIDIGRQLRAAGRDTALVPGAVCLSACPYAFAGGVSRLAAQDALLGVHQHYFGRNTALPAFLAVEDIQRGQGEVMGHLDTMGIDPMVMRLALLTPPDEIYLLTPQERTDFRLTTD
ncbi:MAG: hypothetical protein ACU0BF_01990 [Paracoccaceae bacterium]